MCSDCHLSQVTPHEKLQSDLVEERRKNKELQETASSHLETIKNLRASLALAQKGPADNTYGAVDICFFQKMLPLEIRVKIYTLLLVNPQLADKDGIGENTKYGAQFKYGLSPNILRTCRWVYEETIDVLYGSNKFILLCERKSLGYGVATFNLPQCPLTRYLVQDQYKGDHFFAFEHIAEFKRVRRWRVILECRSTRGSQTEGFFRFCRALSKQSSILSLEVLVMLPEPPSSTYPSNDIMYNWATVDKRMGKTTATLGMLRNVNSVELRPAMKTDLSQCVQRIYKPGFPGAKVSNGDEADSCITIIKGNTPVEKVFEMQARLLSYAQAFERNTQFKAEMEPYGQIWEDETSDRSAIKDYNPFTGLETHHHVERFLKKAHHESRSQQSTTFRNHREAILKYLEPQYKRVVNTYKAFTEFIEKQKTEDGLLDVRLEDNEELEWTRNVFEDALKIVEQHARSFDRDLDNDTSRMVRLLSHGRISSDHMRREKAIVKMDSIQRLNNFGEMYYDEFIHCFRIAVDDMVEQYLDIRKARKALFDFDVQVGIKPPIEVDDDLSDLPIDWTFDARIYEDDD